MYSGILPWVWQDALQKLTAFLHLRPLVMINDMPAFDETKQLTDRWDEVTPVPSAVRMHTMQGVDWAWHSRTSSSSQLSRESVQPKAPAALKLLGM